MSSLNEVSLFQARNFIRCYLTEIAGSIKKIHHLLHPIKKDKNELFHHKLYKNLVSSLVRNTDETRSAHVALTSDFSFFYFGCVSLFPQISYFCSLSVNLYQNLSAKKHSL